MPLEEDKYKWLNEQVPGPGGVNIVISDFIDYDEGNFAKSVIGLNEKLLDGGCKDELGGCLTPVWY